MITFSIEEYWRFKSKFSEKNFILNDTKEEYKLKDSDNKKRKYHDYIFKEILSNKDEFIHFINTYTDYKIKIKENDINRFDKEFITEELNKRESDILYKIEQKNIFIMIEQQTKIDYNMPERIVRYCVELIGTITKGNRKKDEKYPLIYPIVLYTGDGKWNVANSISLEQEEYLNLPKQDYPVYNLVDINNISVQELIQDKSAIAKAILFEKLKTEEDYDTAMSKLMQRELTARESKYIGTILKYSNYVRKYLNAEKVENYKEMLGGDSMAARAEIFFVNFVNKQIRLAELAQERLKIAEEEASKAQEKASKAQEEASKAQEEASKAQEKANEAEKKGISNVVKNMIRKKASDEFILETTQIERKELEKLKHELSVS